MSRGSTLALGRKLRTLRPARRPLGIPAPLPLDAIQRAYSQALWRSLCAPAQATFAPVEREILEDFAAQLEHAVRTDDPKPPRPLHSGRAHAALENAARAFAARVNTGALHELAREFGRRTDRHQRAQLDRQLRAALSVGYGDLERPVRDHVEGWIEENVELIRTVPTRYWDRLRGDVEDAYTGGASLKTFADRLSSRYEMARNDARRIARDQVARLNGRLNRERQTSLGIETAIWRTMRDGRVCDDCMDLDGEEFRWDEPPDGGPPGEHHIDDRCYAEPNLAALLE